MGLESLKYNNIRPWKIYKSNGYFCVNYYRPYAVKFGDIRVKCSTYSGIQKMTINEFMTLFLSTLLLTRQERKLIGN